MTTRFHRIYTLFFVASLAWSNVVTADGVDCVHADTAVAAEICNKTELSQLAALADVLGDIVRLDVRYDEINLHQDFGLSRGISRLLSTLTLAEVETLMDTSQDLAWDFAFDTQNNMLLMTAKHLYLQDGIVVFARSASGASTPVYAEMGYVFDAVREHYQLVGNILHVRSTARPSEGIQKFRYQDGCWRLIGEDRTWAGYMIEFNDDLAAVSINHLTGLAIFDYKERQGVIRTFDPKIRCFSDRRTYHQIIYHDSDG